MVTMTRTRPHMPSAYGISTDDSTMLEWSWVETRLIAARNYWICSVYPDGRPHAAPVWGAWLSDEQRLVFGSDPQARRARNLTANPRVTAHLESGNEAVIIEGHVEVIRNAEMLARAAAGYQGKYGDYQPTAEELGANLMLAVVPRVVLAWIEMDYPNTATRWLFSA